MCDSEIVSHAKQDRSTEDQRAIIHGHRRSRRDRRPETEEDDNDHKDAGDNVDRDPPQSWDSERTPVQTRRPHRIPRRTPNGASAATPEKKRAANEVRRVQSADSERDDVVESD